MKIFNIFSLDEFISILLIIIGGISLLITYIRSRKNNGNVGQLTILQKIPELVVKAELMFGKGRGADKLQYVMTELRVFALENKIKIDNEFLKSQVNAMVDVTKNVNVTINNDTPQDSENNNRNTTTNENKQDNNTVVEIV